MVAPTELYEDEGSLKGRAVGQRFDADDDGKVVDGRIVVLLPVPGARAGGAAGLATGSPGGGGAAGPNDRAQVARAAAASLAAAAERGVPLCEECEQARLRQAAVRG